MKKKEKLENRLSLEEINPIDFGREPIDVDEGKKWKLMKNSHFSQLKLFRAYT